MSRLPVLILSAVFFLPASEAGAQFSLKIARPVEIVTKPDGKHTAEILVEVTFTNKFDRAVKWRTNHVPEFTLFDGAGNAVDTFIVDTRPQGAEKQIEPEKDAVSLEPKKSSTIQIKVWLRALAMEPGRAYMLGDRGLDGAEKVAFVPVVKDGRDKLRATVFRQTVRVRYGKTEHSATIFDIDTKKKVAFALTILSEKVDKVEVIPLYYGNSARSAITELYNRKALPGTVRRAENKIAVVEFPTDGEDFPTLNPQPPPLAKDDFDYEKGTYLACGWNPSLGVTAPCSAIRGGVVNGFSTYYATPRDGWRGSGYYSNSGQLVGICDAAGNGHSGRLGFYVDIKTIRKALKEIDYQFSKDYGKKPKE